MIELIRYEQSAFKKYSLVLLEIVDQLNGIPEVNDKLAYIDYVVNLLLDAVIAEYSALSLYPYYIIADTDYKGILNSCIATFSQYGSTECTVETEGKKIISTVVSKKTKTLIRHLNKNVHNITDKVIYVPQLNLISAYQNRYHELSAIRYKKKNITLNAVCVDLAKQFSNMSTNGIMWYDRKGENREFTSDYRFSLIYTLLKIQSIFNNDDQQEILSPDGLFLEKDNALRFDPKYVEDFCKKNDLVLFTSTIAARIQHTYSLFGKSIIIME